MTQKDGKPVSEGREGLALYLRYLNETVPDLYLVKNAVEKSLDRSMPPGHSTRSMEPVDRELSLSELREAACTCNACPLSATRTHVVFGEGNPKAPLMFVGEGPGADEDASGRPFVGRAGDLLTKMIKAMGYERTDVYIANIVKCRPPGNRVPEEHERQSCLPYLTRQISLVSPNVMVLLGQTAAATLLRSSGGISRIRGKEAQIAEHPGIRVMPTYHPAYLLRNPSAKVEVWDDLKQVMSWLGKERP